MKLKTAFIDAHFPDLRGDSYATGRGAGSTARIAISRAVGNLLKDQKVRRKRISTIKMTVSITERDATEWVDNGPQGA